MSYIEQLAVEVKNNCKAIDDITDFAIKEFIRSFFETYEGRNSNKIEELEDQIRQFKEFS